MSLLEARLLYPYKPGDWEPCLEFYHLSLLHVLAWPYSNYIFIYTIPYFSLSIWEYNITQQLRIK